MLDTFPENVTVARYRQLVICESLRNNRGMVNTTLIDLLLFCKMKNSLIYYFLFVMYFRIDLFEYSLSINQNR